jgi:flagellar biosynthesis protein FliQ
MTLEIPANLLKEGLVLVGVVGGPIFIVMVGVGLVVGILQAATQINDTAVGFLPRALASALCLWLAGGWMMERMSGYLAQSIVRMSGR